MSFERGMIVDSTRENTEIYLITDRIPAGNRIKGLVRTTLVNGTLLDMFDNGRIELRTNTQTIRRKEWKYGRCKRH